MLGAALTPIIWLVAMIVGCIAAWVAGHTISATDWVILFAYSIGCGGYIVYKIKGNKS